MTILHPDDVGLEASTRLGTAGSLVGCGSLAARSEYSSKLASNAASFFSPPSHTASIVAERSSERPGSSVSCLNAHAPRYSGFSWRLVSWQRITRSGTTTWLAPTSSSVRLEPGGRWTAGFSRAPPHQGRSL